MHRIAAVAIGAVGLLTATVAAQPARIDARSSHRAEVRRLVTHPQLADVATRAVARGNDVEIWVSALFSVVVDYASCEEQRDFAASIWLRWSEMVDPDGADVILKSDTGVVLASAGRGLSGPRFHC